MPDGYRFYRKFWLVLTAVFFLVACSSVSAQNSAKPTEASREQGQEKSAEPKRKPADEGAHPNENDRHTTQDTKISPQEAEELFHSVDDILQFASKDTSLPIRTDVKRRLTSRDEVVAYIEKHMAEDEDAKRLERSLLVLRKFGLIPRDFDLKHFLVALLREQVAGYYDPKTKTVNLLNWLGVDEQRPVLAHELTHALQDQNFGLEKWMREGEVDLASRQHLTADDIATDEYSTVRQAVVEGQAMVVLVEYMLAPTGQSLQDSPQIVEALKQGMLVGTADSVNFRNAPVVLRESLIFPYRYGMDFVADVLKSGGKEKAFAAVFKNPPRTTREIMEPQTYLSGERIEPMPVPDLAHIFRNYERFDVGAMGEFDVAILIDQYAGTDTSHELYPHWRGGYYYAVRPKNEADAPLGLFYASRWSSAEKAGEFAAIYAKSLSQRYKRAREAPPSDRSPVLDLEKIERLSGVHTWLTEDGPVVIEVQRDTVLVTESIDPAATEALQHDLFAQPVAAGK
jgi:hypothetical protein